MGINLKALIAFLTISLIIVSAYSFTLYLNLKKVRENYGNLLLSYHNFTQQYKALRINYSLLRHKYQDLKSYITALLNKYWNLSNEYNDLKEEYTELSSINRKLFANLSLLRRSLSRYIRYVDEVNLYTSLTTVNHALRDEFLKEAIASIKPYLKGLSSQSNESLITRLYKWVMLSTYYQNDPYVPTYSWGLYDNIWRLPNQTLMQEGGDCEDLALLIYAALKNYGIKAWLIFWWNGSEGGHTATIAKYDGKWYIIDPVKNWLNGYSYYLRIRFSEGSKEVNALIQPLWINPTLKKWLINDGLAAPLWVNSSGSIILVKEINGVSGLGSLIEGWLGLWGSKFTNYSIMDVGIYKEFSNVSELVNYLSVVGSS